MSDGGLRIFPLGDGALTVEFGRKISESLNRKAIALADHFATEPFIGFVEAVPSYAATTIFYDPFLVTTGLAQGQSPFETVSTLVREVEPRINTAKASPGRVVEVNAIFDGPDLNLIAGFAGITSSDVIEIFLSGTYRVYMLGFLPGFAYMAHVDDRIAMPRKESPRTEVPKGSIGIAGRQAGIYSLPSPGGWQLIGRTDAAMFSPDARPGTLVLPGDCVKFVAR